MTTNAYSRQLPLKNIIGNTDILGGIEDLVLRTNHMIRETYQFLRLYFLYLLENKKELPIIDGELIPIIFTLISDRIDKTKPSHTRDCMFEFYDSHYSNIQTRKVKSVSVKILDYEVITIITCIENHIKNSFFTYINRLVYCLCEKENLGDETKNQRKKLRSDLLNNTFTSDPRFHHYINLFAPTIVLLLDKEDKKTSKLYDEPQSCLQLLYDISIVIEENQGKLLSLLPLRRSLIPSHITIDHTSFIESFRSLFSPTLTVGQLKIQCEVLGYKDIDKMGKGELIQVLKDAGIIVPAKITVKELKDQYRNMIGSKDMSRMKKNELEEILKNTNTKDKTEEEWLRIKNKIYKLFPVKDIAVMDCRSFKTDGVSCSLTFNKSDKYVKGSKRTGGGVFNEQYFEDLKTHEEFKNKKIVAIDPNKGNLVYCYDGEKTLRYTQDERRKVSRKKKYSKIRKKKENEVLTYEGMTISRHMKILSEHNSRSMDVEKFKDFIFAKNEMSKDFSSVYEEPIFRKLRFNSKINLKSSEDKFVNKFKNMYGDPNNVTIVFGDWEERPAFLRGKEPTKGKSMRSLLRKAGYEVYLLDEFRTSKLCHLCNSENEHFQKVQNPKNPTKKKSNYIRKKYVDKGRNNEDQDVWGLLRCTNGNCRRVHNRDFNSSSNIYKISICLIQRGRRPYSFCRTTQTCALFPNNSRNKVKPQSSRILQVKDGVDPSA